MSPTAGAGQRSATRGEARAEAAAHSRPPGPGAELTSHQHCFARTWQVCCPHSPGHGPEAPASDLWAAVPAGAPVLRALPCSPSESIRQILTAVQPSTRHGQARVTLAGTLFVSGTVSALVWESLYSLLLRRRSGLWGQHLGVAVSRTRSVLLLAVDKAARPASNAGARGVEWGRPS